VTSAGQAAPVFRSPLAADANAGRSALVTGGGTGIGRATAVEFARTGARVTVCGRRAEPLAATQAMIEASGGECLPVAADVREPAGVECVVAAALDRFGAIDVLVNGAGGQRAAAAEEISGERWQAVERLAVDAAWNVTRTVAVQSMIPRRGGLVVFIGFSPLRGIPGFAHACAARAAVANLASGLALEWSRYNIRTVCVAAGTILTDGLRRYGEQAIEGWRQAVPLRRLGTPEEVASVIAFLASAGGGYVTGTTIAVDGGADAWGLGHMPPEPAR
jgi:citronellol/citronellal dehydrogenase